MAVRLIRRRGARDDPTHNPREEGVADFAAVAEIDFLKAPRVVRHLQDGRRGDVPDAFHAPCGDVCAALSGQCGEAFVCDVEAVAYVYEAGAGADEGADSVDDDTVGDFAVIGGEVEAVEEAGGFGEEAAPVEGDGLEAH
jgi:hypothetical protein